MEKLFNRFWKWILWSALFALIIHSVFKRPAPSAFFEGVWGAGDILTYISTIILAWVAYWQNFRFKIESDKYQEQQDKVAEETNKKFLALQDNINRQTKLLASLESEKMIPYFRIGIGLTDNGRCRQLTITEDSGVPCPRYNANLKNIGVNGIANIVCKGLSINSIPHQVKSDPSTFGIDPGEVCFIMLPYLSGETQILILKFEVRNIIGQCYDVEYKLPFEKGHCLIGEIVSIEREE